MDYKWVPVVIEEQCTDCGLCVAACGPACLEMVDRIPVLERPMECGSAEHCIDAYPEDAIHMAWVPMEGDKQVGRWQSSPKGDQQDAEFLKCSHLG